MEQSTRFTVGEFVAAGRESLKLEVLSGEGFDRIVAEALANRPGLALTGFYDHFSGNRLQVFGQAEQAYLKSLDAHTRVERFKTLIERGAYCFIFTCGTHIHPDIVKCAQDSGVTLVRTSLDTRGLSRGCNYLLERLAAPRTKIYGTMVEVAGLGVLLEGEPGMGKSETALGLVKHGNALVADDLTCLMRNFDGTITASASPATRDYMEIRGIGFIHVPSVFGVTAVCREKQLDLVVALKRLSDVESELDRTGEETYTRNILGVDIPQLVIPVSAGRDLVNLVETAAQQFKLKMAGHDAVKALDERLMQAAADVSSIKKE